MEKVCFTQNIGRLHTNDDRDVFFTVETQAGFRIKGRKGVLHKIEPARLSIHELRGRHFLQGTG
jgi:hypothetical protein